MEEHSNYAGFTPIEVVQSTVQKPCSTVHSEVVQYVPAADLSTVPARIVDAAVTVIGGVAELTGTVCGLLVAVVASAAETIKENRSKARRVRYLQRISDADQARMDIYRATAYHAKKEQSARVNIQINGGENHIVINQ
jgi:hypothetical protein